MTHSSSNVPHLSLFFNHAWAVVVLDSFQVYVVVLQCETAPSLASSLRTCTYSCPHHFYSLLSTFVCASATFSIRLCFWLTKSPFAFFFVFVGSCIATDDLISASEATLLFSWHMNPSLGKVIPFLHCFSVNAFHLACVQKIGHLQNHFDRRVVEGFGSQVCWAGW